LYFLQAALLCNIFQLFLWRAPAGRAFRYKSSPLVPRGCGLSTSIPHATARKYNKIFFAFATYINILRIYLNKPAQNMQ